MSGARPEDWIRPEIQALSAYHVAPAQGLIKLDAMENPYDWPPELVSAWLEELRPVALNRYPDPAAQDLSTALRAVMAIPPEADLLLGNGSDELLQILALAVGGPGRVILAPEPGFAMYRLLAQIAGAQFVGVPLRGDGFELDLHAMGEAIERHRPALILLAYPNNPTGNLFDPQAIRQILAWAPGLVVIDEAYEPFAQTSFMNELGAYPQLLILRTLSKLGLAGLRLGLLLGDRAWLAQLDKLRLPYNINVLTQQTARFALRHWPVFLGQAQVIRHERGLLQQELMRFPQLTTYPSRANFILFRTPAQQAAAIHAGLMARGVLIKCLHGVHPQLADCLRVTVGKPEENKRFITALADIMSQDKLVTEGLDIL